MSFSATDDLLTRGVAAARDDDRQQARFYLEWVLRDDPTDEQATTAWYWLSRLAADPAERRRCLERVLSRTSLHAEARRDLAILDGRLAPAEMIDLERPPAPLTPAVAADPRAERRHRCPRCGGVVQFSVAHQALACPFCGGHEAGPRPDAVDEQDWFAAAYTARGHRWVLAAVAALRCRACGATHTLPPGRVSGACPFCGSPELVQTEAEHDLMAPDGIVPFAIDQAAARARLKRWHARQRAAHRLTVAPPRPIYLPFWTFDIDAEVHWRRAARDQDMAIRLHDLDPLPAADGTASFSFDDVLVPATRSLPAALLEGLRFATGEPVPYSDDVLAGWPAELYRVPLTDASLVARERALARCRQQMSARSAGEGDDLTVTRIELGVTTYKLLLLPVWVATCRREGQERPLVVNGQTGEVHGGDAPGPLGRLLSWLTEHTGQL